MARYLSDPITVKFTLSDSVIGTNVRYTVDVYGKTINTIYTGTVYATGKEQTLYLNDILYTIQDSYEWFVNTNVSRVVENASYFMPQIRVKFEDGNTYYLTDVVFATRVPNNKTNLPETPSDMLALTPLVECGNKVYPRMPVSANFNSNMFFGTGILHYNGLSNTTKTYIGVFIDNEAGSTNRLGILSISGIQYGENLSKYIYNKDVVNSLSRILGASTDGNPYIGAYLTLGSGQPSGTIKLCEIDYEPAPYYVAWINRFGCWQCQPLHSKYEMTEKVDTKYILTVNNENIPVEKNSEFKWTLNTDWLTYTEHDEFESILTSKYVYLYNTETEEGHYVTVDDSNWTFRNSVNTNKPFNLTLKLSKSFKQNIIL